MKKYLLSALFFASLIGSANASNVNAQAHDTILDNVISSGADAILPSQTSQSGKFLTTNGTVSSWGTPSGSSIPNYYVYMDLEGAHGDCSTDDTGAFNTAMGLLTSAGGGHLIFGNKCYATSTGMTWGNGTNSAASTSGNNVEIDGQGAGGVYNACATTIIYTGSSSSTTPVLTMAGPMLSIGMNNICIDTNAAAGIGIKQIHVSSSSFSNVAVFDYTNTMWLGTTRTGSAGVSYGNCNNTYNNINGVGANNTSVNGWVFTSGATTIGPDSCRNIVNGGTVAYGGNSGSCGVLYSGADNNQMIGTNFEQRGGSTGAGFDKCYEEYGSQTAFPNDNTLISVSGATASFCSGTMVYQNFEIAMPTSDGETASTCSNVATITTEGDFYKAGKPFIVMPDGVNLNVANVIHADATHANATNNKVLDLTSATSGVNYINVTNGATGSGPTVSSAGSDSDIPLIFNAKGVGGEEDHLLNNTLAYQIYNNGSTPGSAYVRFGPGTGTTGSAAPFFMPVGVSNSDINLSSSGTGSVRLGTQRLGNPVLNILDSGQVQFASTSAFTSNGSVATTMTSLGPTGAHTTVQKWLTVKDSAGSTFYIPAY